MKWIGQHIWDYISRFRNDVYLEDISTGTIASGGNLGLDSNNKIVKADTEAGELAFSGSTANGLLTYGGTSTIDVESSFTYTDFGSGLAYAQISASGSGNYPQLWLNNSNTGSSGPQFTFYKSADGADNDELGRIIWNGKDADGGGNTFAEIIAYIAEADATDEAGKLELTTAASNGSTSAMRQALTATGHGTNNIVDIGLGYGAASTTTIAGDLQVVGGDILGPTDGDLNITSDGSIVVNVDNDNDETNQTIKFKYNGSTDGFEFNPSRGSVSQFSTSSGTYPLIYLQNTGDNATGAGHLNFNKKRTDTSTQIGEDDDLIGKTIYTSYNDNGTPELITFAEVQGTIADASDSDEAGKYEVKVTTSNGTTSALQNALSAVGSPSDNDVDVAIGHGASSTTTIKGTLTMGSTAFVNNSGVVQVATQGTIDHDSLANFVANEHIDWTGDVSASSVIHTNNITDLHGAGVDGSANQLLTDDGDGTVTSESGATCNDGVLALTSATTGQGAITLTTTADGNKPTNLSFIKNRASSTALADDLIGMTSWVSDNASGTAKYYAEQYVQAAGVVASDEFARVTHTCATSTGTVSSRQNMITGLGSASANTVNTTLGYGVESTCTIAGDVVLEGDQLRVSGSSTQSGRISLSEDTDNGTDIVTLAAPAATSGQTITLPDATGTVALTSDIVSGWHGSTTRIKILHSDFIISDTGRPYMIDDSGIGAEKLFGETNSTAPCYVTVAIPTGYDATHVMVYGFGTPAVEVWEHQISDKLGVSKGTGNVGTEIDITDVTSSTTNYLFIQVEQGSSDEIYGGYVTIAAT